MGAGENEMRMSGSQRPLRECDVQDFTNIYIDTHTYLFYYEFLKHTQWSRNNIMNPYITFTQLQ